jgi:hypothetical protein
MDLLKLENFTFMDICYHQYKLILVVRNVMEMDMCLIKLVIKCHVFDVIHEMGIVKDVLVVFGISRNLKLVSNVIKEEV